MSKAFTKEDDDREDLPPGTKNYLTPDGAKRSRAGLDAKVQDLTRILDSAVSLDVSYE